MATVRALAHVLLAVIFVSSGLDVARHPGHRTQLAAAIGVPQPELAVRANGAVMALAGAALALGIFPRWAAVILAASLVPTTVAGHPFWKEQEPQKRTTQRIHFLKNVAIIGGLMLAATEDEKRAAK